MSDNTPAKIRQALDTIPKNWSVDEKYRIRINYEGVYQVAMASSYALASFIAQAPEWLRYLLAQLDAKDTEIAERDATIARMTEDVLEAMNTEWDLAGETTPVYVILHRCLQSLKEPNP